MSTEPAPIDDLIERLRARVDERRAAGEYPEGLEEQLDEHFRRIAFHRARVDTEKLHRAVQTFEERIDFAPHEIAIESGVPGGELLHKAINKAMNRQRQAVLEQCATFADAVRDVVRELASAIEDPKSHEHGDLEGRIDTLVERVAGAELAELRRRVELLEQRS